MAVLDSGNDTAGKANVDDGFNLNVSLTNTPSLVGAVRLMSENDPGERTGAPLLQSPETSQDFRLRVGTDTILLTETFNATAQNTNNWSYTFATLTASLPGAGVLRFSNVQGTTSAHGAFLRSFQYFPLVGTAPLYFEVTFGQQTAAMVANEVFLAGLGIPSAATTPPTDGVWVRLSTAGLEGVLAYNGVTVSTTFGTAAVSLDAFGVSSLHKVTITIGESSVQFWIDDEYLGALDVPVSNGQPFISGGLPAFLMKYNTGAVSNTNIIAVSDLTVSLADVAANKPAATQAAIAGQACYVGQNGHTQGSTCGGFGQGAIAATSAGSNTAANVTGLGGLGVMTAQATNAGAAGDMIASSYQNPAGTVNITGRNLVITGVSISCMNTGAAVATTPTSLIWGLAFGHTAVSLATAETASFATATTHAPRRIALGCMSAAVGAAVGASYDRDIRQTFSTPIVIRPGEFIATTVRFRIGTATASQEVTYLVTFDGYFE